MRKDGDFINGLREEILSGQERRSKYVILKLSFIVGLFGIGSMTISSVSLNSLIYLVPLVVAIFDLYILGEDFGVKRAGRFIKGSPATPIEEKRWEQTVHDNRDPVTYIASVISSLIVIAVAIVALWKSEHTLILYRIWCVGCTLLIIFTAIYGYILVRKTNKLDKYLQKRGF